MRFAGDETDINLKGVTVKSATGDYDCIPANVTNIQT
jgi:hypothetical protein